ncbi:hypothetical protein Tco_1143552 [Tanacetum coccineum]
MADQDTPPPTITAMKIPIIKKGEYDIWSMRMRQYICHTDHNMWDIIVNGDLEDEATPSGEQSSPPVPNQERIKSILLLAIPDEYLLKFHNVPDAKSLWAAIKSRFRGNQESKKMQKNVLKHQFKNFVTASNETLDKAYDRFQKLITLIMRNKPDIDEVDIDDLYNNLRVYEDELKSTASGDFGVSIAGGINQVPTTLRLEEIWTLKKNDLFLLISQRLNATTVIEKDILLENVDLEVVKEEDLMLKMAGIMQNQLNLPLRHWWLKMNELAWGERYEFQNYDLKCREIKINNLNLELEKVVKERDELKLKIEKQEGSSKNLTEIINSQMSTHDKNGLGFGTQMDNLSNKSETDSENSLTIFEVKSSDEESTLENNMFIKANEYHVVPPPITWNLLTPRPDITFAGLDEYASRNKIIESKITKTNKTLAKTLSKVASQGVSKEKLTDKGKRYRRRARSMAKKNWILKKRLILVLKKLVLASHKTKEQMRQEQVGLEEAIKLQAQLDEEVAKQIHLDKMIAKRMAEEEALSEQQKKRKAQVQFEAQFYTEEDCYVIRAKLEANAELTKDVLAKDLPKQDFAKRMAEMVNQRKKHFAEERAKAKRNKPFTS